MALLSSIMARLLHALTALLMLLAWSSGGPGMGALASPAGHDALSAAMMGGLMGAVIDCPHENVGSAALPPGKERGNTSHGGPAMPLPLCCPGLLAANIAPVSATPVAPREPASAPLRPASDRLPSGLSPGPDRPPPRARAI